MLLMKPTKIYDAARTIFCPASPEAETLIHLGFTLCRFHFSSGPLSRLLSNFQSKPPLKARSMASLIVGNADGRQQTLKLWLHTLQCFWLFTANRWFTRSMKLVILNSLKFYDINWNRTNETTDLLHLREINVQLKILPCKEASPSQFSKYEHPSLYFPFFGYNVRVALLFLLNLHTQPWYLGLARFFFNLLTPLIFNLHLGRE